MVRMKDIAEHFGLSVSTVSRILSGKGRVSEETAEKVLSYAKSVDFYPNIAAQQLKENRTEQVAVVVPDIGIEFYARLYEEIDSSLKMFGKSAILVNVGRADVDELSYINLLKSHAVDSMVIATRGSASYAGISESLLRRIVFVDNWPRDCDACFYVGSDNVNSARMSVLLASKVGYEHPIMLASCIQESSAIERIEGFRLGLETFDIKRGEEFVYGIAPTLGDSYQLTMKLLRSANRPDCIIAHNNVMGYGAVKAVRDSSLKVSEEVGIICFDHIDRYGICQPTLTTLNQSVPELARAICRLTAEQANEMVDFREIVVNTELVKGETFRERKVL